MNYISGLLDFVDKGTTAITAVSYSVSKLVDAGFKKLEMGSNWQVSAGGKYYVHPYPSALVAFTVGRKQVFQKGFKIITSHTDQPGFRVKSNPEVTKNGYLQLNIDVYGGPILYSWLDRPLSLAGQVVLTSEDVMKPRVIDIDFRKPLLQIPSLAIHFERNLNEGFKFDRQTHLQPIMKLIDDKFSKEGYLQQLIAKEIGCEAEEILSYELTVYNMDEGMLIGVDQDMISAPRLDNLAMIYCSIEALMAGDHDFGINMIACFDNEEIGSTTKQGADSMLFAQIMERVGIGMNLQPHMFYRTFEDSFMISADGVHGTHPNWANKNDITNEVRLGGGVAIKYSINQQYSTDAVSSGIMQQVCKKADVSYQQFYNRSGIPGGKTLGPLANKYVPIKTVDMGIPMLAMHSTRELVATKDVEDCMKVFSRFFEWK